MAQLLELDEQSAEDFLSEIVSSKQLVAKIDRPAGIVTFKVTKTHACMHAYVCTHACRVIVARAHSPLVTH